MEVYCKEYSQPWESLFFYTRRLYRPVNLMFVSA